MTTPSDTPEKPAGKKSSRRAAAADSAKAADSSAPAAGKTAKPARPGRLTGGLALVFAIIALLISSWLAYLIESKRGLSDAKGRLVHVEQDTAALQELAAGMNQELTALRETQTTLKDGLQAMQGELGKGRRAWLLTETENLMVIARHRLAYARDARLALEALRTADRQLKQLGDPEYLPVRRQLEKEIAALDDYEKLDPASMARRLGELAVSVGDLPFAPETRPASELPPGEQGFAREVWQDIKGLVRIRSTTDIRRPFILPEQKYYLRENLRLMLYGAQVALLHGDGLTFERNTRAAHQWLGTYYDADAQVVRDGIAALDAMLKTRPAGLPEIGASLKALQDLHARSSGS